MSLVEKGFRTVDNAKRRDAGPVFEDRTAFARQISVVFEEKAEITAQPAPLQRAALTPGSTAAEDFRLLRTKIRGIAQERPFGCVGVVSATPGEGKTTIAIGLAAALADAADRRVLFVEADLRRPAAEEYLGLPRTPGLAEWLDGSSVSIPLRRIAPLGFWLLSAGEAGLASQDALGAPRMAALLDACREQFDSVVVDCPPLAPVADSVMLQDSIDGFLLVVRARHAPRDVIQRAVSHLRPERVAGVVFNDQQEVFPGYSFSYAYGRPRLR
jgi:Mrp family chromosome partitioning ATPase